MKPRFSLSLIAIAMSLLLISPAVVNAKDSLKTIMKTWKPQNALAKELINGATPYDQAAAKGILELYLAGQTELSGRIAPDSAEGKIYEPGLTNSAATFAVRWAISERVTVSKQPMQKSQQIAVRAMTNMQID